MFFDILLLKTLVSRHQKPLDVKLGLNEMPTNEKLKKLVSPFLWLTNSTRECDKKGFPILEKLETVKRCCL